MSFEFNPASTQVPPPPQTGVSPVSFADFARETHTTPRPASMVLDLARQHAFTGEITFMIDPLVRVYLDGGSSYLAEVDGSPSISQQLLSAQVIESPQLERGIVRVGDLEHLGRLFDRDETIDRDAVMVVIEHHTDQLVQLLCESVVSAVEISSYRHHPSGVHRWFVTQVDNASGSRPVSDVAQVDHSVVDELPGLGRGGTDLRIEWTEPDPSGLGVPADSLVDLTAPTDADLQAELDRFDADEADWAAGVTGGFAASNVSMPSPLGEFHIVWPDGTTDPDLVNSGNAGVAETPDNVEAVPEPHEPSLREPAVGDEPEPPLLPSLELDDDPRPLLAPTTPPTDAPPTDAPPSIELANPFVDDDAAGPDPAALDPAEPDPAEPDRAESDMAQPAPRATIEPLVLDEIPKPDAAIPDDVAEAVKRALAAIDEASSKPISLPGRSSSISLPLLDVAASTSLDTPAVQPPAPIPPPPAPPGFAPPSVDTSAEAMYERVERQPEPVATPQPATPQPAAPTPVPPQPVTEVLADEPPVDTVVEPFDDVVDEEPTSGTASVVFVDEEPTPAGERRGALRRLIRSLRNSDDG